MPTLMPREERERKLTGRSSSSRVKSSNKERENKRGYLNTRPSERESAQGPFSSHAYYTL